MNLLQKAIIRNMRDDYEDVPYSEDMLKELLNTIHLDSDPTTVTSIMSNYNHFVQTNEEYVKEQNRIYGGNFDEQIALKRGSKIFTKIIKELIKLIKSLPQNSREKYIPQAKLLLKILKAEQSYSNEDVREALENVFHIAYNLWCLDSYGADGQYVVDGIYSICTSAEEIESEI